MLLNEILYRLAQRCKSIKHLALYKIDGDDEAFEVIRLFECIECLKITVFNVVNRDSIISLVQSFSLLRHLDIGLDDTEINSSFVLALLSKCSRLEKFSVGFNYLCYDFGFFTSAEFFNDFRECIQMRNVTVEVFCTGNYHYVMVGMITKDQVVWRNKLVRWVGYDPSRNLSQTNLFDLANQLKPMNSSNAKQSKPFDRILSYLDLNSLQSLSRTNKKCSQPVDSFIKQHCEQQETFTITNEFFTLWNSYYKHLDDFDELNVTNLRVNIYHRDISALRNIIKQFHNLNKLYIYSSILIDLSEMIVPQVRHLIYD